LWWCAVCFAKMFGAVVRREQMVELGLGRKLEEIREHECIHGAA